VAHGGLFVLNSGIKRGRQRVDRHGARALLRALGDALPVWLAQVLASEPLRQLALPRVLVVGRYAR